jgi:hypothetical protein
MATPLNSTKGAALIDAAIAPERGCSRQNLEKLCEKGGLLGSPCILRAKPLLVDADILLDEYLARVAPFQVEAVQPAAKRKPASQAPLKLSRPPSPALGDDDLCAQPDADDEAVPNFHDERALHEREKRLIARMERKKEANKLLPREEVFPAWDAAVNITRTTMLGVASKLKQQIPHLTPDEVAVAQDLIREALESLASGDLRERYPEVEP